MKNFPKIYIKLLNFKAGNLFNKLIFTKRLFRCKNSFSFCNTNSQIPQSIIGENDLDLQSLFQKGLDMKKDNSFNESIRIFNICLSKLENTPNKDMQYRIYNELSYLYFFQANRNESISMAERAKEFAQSNFGLYSDQTFSANVLLSSLHNKCEKYEKCLAFDLENLHIIEYKVGRNSLKYAQGCNDVGLSHILNDNLVDAEEYLNECVNVIKKLKDDKCREMIIPLFNFSLLCKKKQLTKKAYKYAEEAIELNNKYNDKYEFSYIYIELRKNLADIYHKLGYYLDAISILNKLTKFCKEIKDYEKKDQYFLYVMISNNYKALGENNLAEEYLSVGKKLLEN